MSDLRNRATCVRRTAIRTASRTLFFYFKRGLRWLESLGALTASSIPRPALSPSEDHDLPFSRTRRH